MPRSFAQRGSCGSLMNAIVIVPLVARALLDASAMRMIVEELATAFTMIRGRQPILFTAMKARMAGLGVATTTRKSARDPRRRVICDETSTSVTSYDCVATT